MKKTLSLFLSVAMLPQLGAAELLMPSFDSIRTDATNNQDIPSVGNSAPNIVDVKYKKEDGPAAKRPPQPPNLNESLIEALLKRIVEIDGASGHPTLQWKAFLFQSDGTSPVPNNCTPMDTRNTPLFIQGIKTKYACTSPADDPRLVRLEESLGLTDILYHHPIPSEPVNNGQEKSPWISIGKAMDDSQRYQYDEAKKAGRDTWIEILKAQSKADTPSWKDIINTLGNVAAEDYGKNKQYDWDKTVDKMLQIAIVLLKDPHSDYWDPKEFAYAMDQLSGSFVGIGAEIATDPKGVKIRRVIPGGGAEKAGLLAGDVITGLLKDDAPPGIDHLIPFVGMDSDSIVKRLHSKKADSHVTLQVLRNSNTLEVEVTRTVINQPNLLQKPKIVAPGVGYVYLKVFANDADKKVLDQVRQLRAEGATAVILDVRGDGGGNLEALANIASEFFKDGQEILSLRHQNQVAERYVTTGDGEFANVRVAVLIDDNSASASEILAASMQDVRCPSAPAPCSVVIGGSNSFGKGSQQQVIPFKGIDGEERGLHITENQWFPPKGKNVDALRDPSTGQEIPGTGGVVPNIKVPVGKEQEQAILEYINAELTNSQKGPAPADPVLAKAIEVLSNANSN